jgi:hypothetical protein
MDKYAWIRQNFERLKAEYQDTPMTYQAITDFDDFCITRYLNSVNTRNFGKIDFNYWIQENNDVLKADYTHNNKNLLLSFEDYCRNQFYQYCYVKIESEK